MLEASESEKYLIAKILIDESAEDFAAALAAGIQTEFFTVPVYAAIWKEWLEAKKEKKALPNSIALGDRFPQFISVLNSLHMLATQTAALKESNLNSWCDFIIQAAAARAITAAAHAAIENFRDPSASNRNTLATLANNLKEWQYRVTAKNTQTLGEIAYNLAVIMQQGGLPHLPMFSAASELAEKVKVHAGEIMTIGAKSGNGKTAFAAGIVRRALEAKKRIFYICTETDSKGIFARIVAQFSNVSHGITNRSKARTNQIDFRKFADTMVDVHELYSNTLHICGCETGIRKPSQIEAKVEQITREYGKVDAVVVDYLQQIQSDYGREKNRNEQLIDIADDLNFFAQKHQIALIVLSQLNRSGVTQGQVPDLEAIRDSSGIVDASSIVAFLFRPKDKQGRPAEKTNFYSVKTRNIDPFAFELSWNGVGFE